MIKSQHPFITKPQKIRNRIKFFQPDTDIRLKWKLRAGLMGNGEKLSTVLGTRRELTYPPYLLNSVTRGTSKCIKGRKVSKRHMQKHIYKKKSVCIYVCDYKYINSCKESTKKAYKDYQVNLCIKVMRHMANVKQKNCISLCISNQ